jgi:acetyl esterase/lipase
VNIPTLMTRIAALRGHPIPISSQPAPLDTEDSKVITASADEQIRQAKGVATVRNVVFARFAGARPNGSDLVLRMDITKPTAPGTHPLVVYIPGGGFVVAAKIGAGRMRRYVAAAGYVVASVEYRTTRHGTTYVDGVADVRAAISFLRAHAEEHGIDPSRVAVWGESAGGYLASMVGVTNRSKRFDPDAAGDVLAVVNKFGGSSLGRLAEGFDPETVAAVNVEGNPIARYVYGPGAKFIDDDPVALKAADPATYVSATSPPFLFFHGSDDRLISPVQTAALHQALRKVGADSTRYVVLGAGHGDIAVKGGEEKFWTTVPMMRIITDFLDRTIVQSSDTRPT